ncbi:hypothetical protein Ancab_032630 [Ancistrocladus abbreviatus]
MWDIKLLVVGLLVVLISHWVYTWRNPKSSGKLPPGSMGLPFIGETIQYFAPNSVFGVPPFIARRVARYGSLFRTSIIGQKVVGRRNAVKVIQHVLNERKQQSKAQHHDFVDFLLEEVKREDSSLDEEGTVDLVFVLLFASHETASSAMTLAINFLAHNPSVLHQLTKEQTEVATRLEIRKSKMTWEDYRSMSFTHMGKELHMGTKSFMAFGGGARLCAGADFAKLQMALFLHHLLTKYKWRKIKGGNILRTPGLIFPNGLHIQLVPKESGIM